MINLIQGDCLDKMKEIPDESIDCVITSPPYNVNLAYNIYNDNKEHQDYIEWLKSVLIEIYRILKSGGRVCINIGDGKNGNIPTHSDIIQFMNKEIGYIPLTTIIWNKNQTGNRTAWGSFQSPSCPSFPTPFEYILVFAKDNIKLQTKGDTDLTKEEFVRWSLPLWTFTPEINQKKIGHPAMFPEELPKRLIKMFSWKNATILDPFMGSGTTGVACKNLNRNFIGIELDPTYFQIAKERIEETQKKFN